MPSMPPTPNRPSGRIYARFRIEGIFFLDYDSSGLYYDWRRRYHYWWPLNDDRRPANHDCFGNDGCAFLDNDARSRPALDNHARRRVGLNFPRANFLGANFLGANFPLMVWNFGITSDRQVGGHCR